MAELLSDEELAEQMPDGWEQEGDEIVRSYEFDAYLDGVGFAAGAGGVAQDAFHHPTITIEYGSVEVRLTSHEEGGVTEKDLDLARRFDDIHD
jgi:4a-hydroxytetrahydrobiopterin dehydratase